MSTTYGQVSYNDIIRDCLDEIDRDEQTNKITPESMQGYILQGCQQITTRYPYKTERLLRCIVEQTDYLFADSTVPVNGTGTVDVLGTAVTGDLAAGPGTITTSQGAVTGVATTFLSLKTGQMIVAPSGEAHTIISITDNLHLQLDGGFALDIATASAYQYSTTRFTKEFNASTEVSPNVGNGSVIKVGGIAQTVLSITDGYNLIVASPFPAAQSTQAFTIDTVVTQIPTEFLSITNASRVDSGFELPVTICDITQINMRKQYDLGLLPYSNLERPFLAAPNRNSSGQRILTVYPSADFDKTIKLFGFIRVNPTLHRTEALTAFAPLDESCVPAIKEYVKYRIYGRIDQPWAQKKEADQFQLFNRQVDELIANMQVTKKRLITYR